MKMRENNAQVTGYLNLPFLRNFISCEITKQNLSSNKMSVFLSHEKNEKNGCRGASAQQNWKL